MKEINLSADVRAKIESLIVELNGICVANELPFVAATVLTRKRTADGEVNNTRVVSAYINWESGATDPFILGAVKLLKTESSASDVAARLLNALLSRAQSDDCDCPACQARRAAEVKH